jgi:hypothetical protein
MKKAFIVKVERNGIIIPKERLDRVKEGDLVEIQIIKVHVNEKIKKGLIQVLNL